MDRGLRRDRAARLRRPDRRTAGLELRGPWRRRERVFRLGRGSTFGERVDRAVATHPDVIVVQGSLNERNSTVQALTAAADETLARLRAEADPHTRILVMGASYTPGTPKATIDWINRAIRGAAAKARLDFVDPAAEDWTDPHDAALWSDQNHLDDAGCQVLADHLEPLLRALVSGSAVG